MYAKNRISKNSDVDSRHISLTYSFKVFTYMVVVLSEIPHRGCCLLVALSQCTDASLLLPDEMHTESLNLD